MTGDTFDVVTFGETMIRHSVAPGERLETAHETEMRAAGAESNVAVTVSRLGGSAAWLSKLPDSALARHVEASLRTHGVTPVVARSDEGRVGVYYLEPAGEPRGTNVVYDRAGAAIRTATPEDLATDHVESARAFHVSGITPALSETLADTTRTLLDRAVAADTHTVFDLNYRGKLWTHDEARETCEPLLDAVDTFVVAERDASAVLDYDGEASTVAADLAAAHDCETVVVTRGAEGAVAVHDGDVIDQGAFPADTFDPIGTGDAFVGGYLARWLDGASVEEALEYGAATAALKRTVGGDVATVTPEEVDRVVASDTSDITR
ncbi:bifunctional 2-dehydro-3-deoxygluconokinase/2-dehydro-3-deoxygalactonokinase [Halomarina salina]|uniref:Bifunctional 2-dehydro-3-deoxygluconokinase/2-dehydro-3-deoxygalactonokinase n=1 Tax=Halomarina salina TaxID=1872699 RepID=A0ABD5RIC5_9EURY|nr:bifunctional 2-dehydro-3-deoxygluconokinase/2-dehydro-3-deoxygalactonokinase [Halomarina salina]